MNDMTKKLLPYLLFNLEIDDLETIIDVVTAYEGKQDDCVSQLLVELKQRPSVGPLLDRRRQDSRYVPLTIKQS